MLEIYACLIDRGHTKAEIETLDDFWLYHIYWHPKDKNGNVAVRAKGKEKTLTRRDYWLAWGRDLGLPDWYSLERFEQENAEAENLKATASERMREKQAALHKKTKANAKGK